MEPSTYQMHCIFAASKDDQKSINERAKAERRITVDSECFVEIGKNNQCDGDRSMRHGMRQELHETKASELS